MTPRDTDTKASGEPTLGRPLHLVLSWLLSLYSPGFQADFGDDFRQTFTARLLDARDRKGRRGVIAFVLRQLPDMLLAAIADRREAARQFDDHFSPARSPSGFGDTMRSFLLDLRLAVRTLATKNPGLALISILTLALGVGATTAIISVVKGVLLDPLPFPQPEQVVRLYQETDHGANRGFFAAPNLFDLREQATGFAAIGAFSDYSLQGIDLTEGDRAERLEMLRVSAGFFEALGTPPLLGRVFTQEDEITAVTDERGDAAEDTRAHQPVAIVSHGLWTRHLNADPGALGRTIALDGAAVTVVGVMPPEFGKTIGVDRDVWLPLDLRPSDGRHRGNFYLSAVGRLQPGVAPEQAQAELEAVFARIATVHPRTNKGVSARLVPLSEDLVGGARPMLLALLASGALVLLVCAVNVANLFLVRGLGREQEMAIRSAMGAGGVRLLGAGAAEGVVVSVLGGAAGIALAFGGVELLARLRPASLPRAASIAIDTPVLLTALATTLLAGLFFSLIPAGRALRLTRLTTTVRSTIGLARPGFRRFQSSLVVTQVAGALILLTGGGLLMRSFSALQAVELGFDAENVTTFKLRLPDYRYADPEKRIAFYRQLHERLGALPGARATGATSKLPADGHRNHWGFGIEGRPRQEGTPVPSAEIRCVDGQYLDTFGISLLRGRGITRNDRGDSEAVVLVSQALADRYFADTEVLGTRVQVGGTVRTIVGVTADTRVAHRDQPTPLIYIPHEQFAADRNWDLTFAVALDGSASAGPGMALGAEAAIRQVAAELDPLLAVYDVRPMTEVVARGVDRARFATLLMSLFAAAAVLLAGIGLYGTLAYGVRQRLGEIGIRKALGARAGHVLGLVVRQGLLMTSIGIGIGAAGAFVLGRLLESLLFGVRSNDPATLAATTAVLLSVAAAACLLPAWRAAKVDPAMVLRDD